MAESEEKTPEQREKEREHREKERLRALAFMPGEDAGSEFGRTRTEQRIDAIVALMCHGKWVTGTSHRTMADLFNVSIPTIENYAAEANRVIRRLVRESPEDRADMLARLKQTFERLGEKAERRGSEKGYRDAIEAYKMLALLHGVVKQQISVEDADPFEGWTRADKEHFVKTGEPPGARSPGVGDAGTK